MSVHSRVPPAGALGALGAVSLSQPADGRGAVEEVLGGACKHEAHHHREGERRGEKRHDQRVGGLHVDHAEGSKVQREERDQEEPTEQPVDGLTAEHAAKQGRQSCHGHHLVLEHGHPRGKILFRREANSEKARHGDQHGAGAENGVSARIASHEQSSVDDEHGTAGEVLYARCLHHVVLLAVDRLPEEGHHPTDEHRQREVAQQRPAPEERGMVDDALRRGRPRHDGAGASLGRRRRRVGDKWHDGSIGCRSNMPKFKVVFQSSEEVENFA